MTSHAKGTFEVTLTPQGSQETQEKTEGAALGRMTIDKHFHGDVEGVSKGEMLTAMTESTGSAAYVAVERVTGTLHGKSGTFALMHNATMSRDSRELNIRVVPLSGTGELTGISGKLSIDIVDKKHFYDLEYTLDGS